MKIEIELDHEKTDEIVIADLQQHIDNLEEEHDADNEEYLLAFRLVLDWYGG